MPRYQPRGRGPAAPLVEVTFSSGGKSRRVPGIIDTGASVTQVPQPVVQFLGLRRTGEITFKNADDSEVTQPSYKAEVSFEGMDFELIEVVSSEFPLALVGRDILNGLITHLDGPAQEFSVTRP